MTEKEKQLSAMASTEEKYGQFPDPPRLQDFIHQGVLKEEGAKRYDERFRSWFIRFQHVLKQGQTS